MKSFVALTTFALLSNFAITPVSAKPIKPVKDLYCNKYYPDATYEELKLLCDGDVQPGTNFRFSGDGWREWKGKKCFAATRIGESICQED